MEFVVASGFTMFVLGVYVIRLRLMLLTETLEGWREDEKQRERNRERRWDEEKRLRR